jgi:Ni/Fe-hydrogenase 1 B-type cytochrome subunit
MPVARSDGWAAKVPRMTRRAPDHALEYKEYLAWDAPTRWFHWINALAVLGLIGTGLGVLNDDALGLSAGGKILLKSIHVLFGYVMGANLLWRFIWAFYAMQRPNSPSCST